jgi:uncharacterized repeat protein (TIGR01451 family)
MKKFVILLCLGFLWAASAGAAVIINTCTSTYQIEGYSIQPSGWDTVAIITDTAPSLVITKLVKNLRTGIESNDLVTALMNDTVEFTIIWTNYGGAADTITLTDYIPTGLTYQTASLSDTEANCDTSTYGTATYTVAEKKVYYMTTTVAGANPGPSGNGIIRFRAKVD